MPAKSEKQRLLERLQEQLGPDIMIELSPSQGTNKSTREQEYALTFRAANDPLNPDARYSTRISTFTPSGDFEDEVVLESMGAGYNLHRGEVRLTEEGLNYGDKPYLTGFESFTKRVRQAFNLYNDESYSSDDEARSVGHYISEFNQFGGSGYGNQYSDIPSSSTYIGPQTSMEQIRFLSGTKRVSFEDKLQHNETTRKQAQDRFLQATQIGAPSDHRLSQLQGGAFVRDDQNRMLYATKGALGSTYIDENGNLQVDTLSKKPLTKSYPFDRRDRATSYVKTSEGRYMPLDQAGVRQQESTVVRGGWDRTSRDITIGAFYPMGGLPLPGGYAKFQLPEDVRKQVHAAGGDQGVLSQGFQSVRMAPIRGITEPGQLFDEKGKMRFKINAPQFRQEFGAAQRIPIGSFQYNGEDRPIEIEGGDRSWMTEKMVMEVPVSWAGQDQEALEWGMQQRGIEPGSMEWEAQIRKNNTIVNQWKQTQSEILRQNNLTADQMDFVLSDSDEIRIGAQIYQEDSASFKSLGTKGYASGGFIGDMQGKGFEVLRPGEQTGQGLQYNLLTELKSNSAAMMGAMEVMDRGTLADFIGEMYGAPTEADIASFEKGLELPELNTYDDRVARFRTMAGGPTSEQIQQTRTSILQGQGAVDLSQVAQSLGMRTTERLTGDLFNRVMGVERAWSRDESGGARSSWTGMRPLAGEELERQERMIGAYGVGRTRGDIAVGQMFTSTKDRFFEEFYGALKDPRFGDPSANQYNAFYEQPSVTDAIKQAAPMLVGSETEKRGQAQQLFDSLYRFGDTQSVPDPNDESKQLQLQTMYLRNAEGIYARRQMGTVYEYAGGMDTIDTQFMTALESQGETAALKWLENEQLNPNREKGARQSLKNLRMVRVAADAALKGRNVMQLPTQLATTIGQESVSGGKITAEEMRQFMEATQGTPGERMQQFAQWYTGRSKEIGASPQMMWLPGTQIALPNPNDLLAIENEVLTLGEDNKMGMQTNAHVMDRMMRYYQQAFQMEESGITDTGRIKSFNQRLNSFLADPTSGKELNMRQVYQGWSGRYAGELAVPEGRAFIPDQELKRLGSMFGLKDANTRELAQAFNNVPAIWMRDPIPTLGGKGYGGSIRKMGLMTSASALGALIQGGIDYGAVNPPPMMVNPLSKSEQGDLDADPFRMIPLATFQWGMTDFGGAISVKSFLDGDKSGGKFQDFMREAAASYDPDFQQKLYDISFGDGGVANTDPVRSPILASMLTSLQMQEDASPGSTMLAEFNKRAGVENRRWVSEENMKTVADTVGGYDKLREEARVYNENKGSFMGQFYNVFKRWTLGAGMSLNMPIDKLAEASDYASNFYQRAIDSEGKPNALSRLMQTAGIYRKKIGTNESGQPQYKYELNAMIGDNQWAENGLMNVQPSDQKAWEAGQKHFFGNVASAIMGDEQFSPEAAARYLAQIPNTGNQIDDERAYEQNVAAIEDTVRQIRGTQYSDDPEMDRSMRGQALRDVVENKLWNAQGTGAIGWNALAPEMMLTQIAERATRPDRGEAKYIGKEEWAELDMKIDRPYASGRELTNRVLPTRWAFDVLRNKSTNQLMQDDPVASRRVPFYQDPVVIQRALMQADKRGFWNHPIMRELRHNISDPMGFARPGAEQSVTLPSGQVLTYKNEEEFENVVDKLQGEWRQSFSNLFNPDAPITSDIKLGSSFLGPLSNFYRDKNFSRDKYRSSLTTGMRGMVGTLAGDLALGIGDPMRFYEQDLTMANVGKKVEDALAQNKAFTGQYGMHMAIDHRDAPYYTLGQTDAGKDIKLSLAPDALNFEVGPDGEISTVDVMDIKDLPGKFGMEPDEIMRALEEEETYPLQMASYMEGMRRMATEDSPEMNKLWEKIRTQWDERRMAHPELNLPELTDKSRKSLATAKIRGRFGVLGYTPETVGDAVKNLPGMSQEDLSKVLKTVEFGEYGDANVSKWTGQLRERAIDAKRGGTQGMAWGARYGAEVLRQQLASRGISGMGTPDPEILQMVQDGKVGDRAWAGWKPNPRMSDRDMLAMYQRADLASRHARGLDVQYDDPDNIATASTDETGQVTSGGSVTSFSGNNGRGGRGGGDEVPPGYSGDDEGPSGSNGSNGGGFSFGGNERQAFENMFKMFGETMGSQIQQSMKNVQIQNIMQFGGGKQLKPADARALAGILEGEMTRTDLYMGGIKEDLPRLIAENTIAGTQQFDADGNLKVDDQGMPIYRKPETFAEAIAQLQGGTADISAIVKSDPGVFRSIKQAAQMRQMAKQALSNQVNRDRTFEALGQNDAIFRKLRLIAGDEINSKENPLSPEEIEYREYFAQAERFSSIVTGKPGQETSMGMRGALATDSEALGTYQSKLRRIDELKLDKMATLTQKSMAVYESNVAQLDNMIADLGKQHEQFIAKAVEGAEEGSDTWNKIIGSTQEYMPEEERNAGYYKSRAMQMRALLRDDSIAMNDQRAKAIAGMAETYEKQADIASRKDLAQKAYMQEWNQIVYPDRFLLLQEKSKASEDEFQSRLALTRGDLSPVETSAMRRREQINAANLGRLRAQDSMLQSWYGLDEGLRKRIDKEGLGRVVKSFGENLEGTGLEEYVEKKRAYEIAEASYDKAKRPEMNAVERALARRDIGRGQEMIGLMRRYQTLESDNVYERTMAARDIQRAQLQQGVQSAEDAFVGHVNQTMGGDAKTYRDALRVYGSQEALAKRGTNKELTENYMRAQELQQGVIGARQRLSDFEAPVNEMDINRFKALSAASKDVTDKMEALQKAMESGSESAVQSAKHEVNLAKARERNTEITANAAKKFEEIAGKGSAILDRDGGVNKVATVNAMKAYLASQMNILSSGAATPEEKKLALGRAEGIQTELNSITESDTQVAQAATDKRTSRGELGLGGAARRLFGGFGLMYMRSLGNLLVGPSRVGYGEALQEQMQLTAGLGAAVGGMDVAANPELYNERVRARYGGGGYRTLRGIESGILENAPGLYRAGQSAFAGLAAFGGASWILPQIFPALAGAAGAATMMPLGLGIGAAVALGSSAVNAIGAYNDVDTSTGMLSQVMETSGKKGSGTMFGLLRANAQEDAHGRKSSATLNARIEQFAGVRQWIDENMGDSVLGDIGRFGLSAGAWLSEIGSGDEGLVAATNPETYRKAKMLSELRTKVSDGMDINRAMEEMGIDESERGFFLKQYGSSRLQEYKNVPTESLIQAAAFEYNNRTNLGSKFGLFASALSQGVNYEDMASNFLGAGGFTAAQMYGGPGSTMTGNMVMSMLNQPGRYDTASMNLLNAGAQFQASFGANINYWDKPKGDFDMDAYLAEMEGRLERYATMNAPSQELFREEKELESMGKQLGFKDVAEANELDYLTANVRKSGRWGEEEEVYYTDKEVDEETYRQRKSSNEKRQLLYGRAQQYQSLMRSFGMDYEESLGLTSEMTEADIPELEARISMASKLDNFRERALTGGMDITRANEIFGGISKMALPEQARWADIMSLNPIAIANQYASMPLASQQALNMMPLHSYGAQPLTMADMAFTNIDAATGMPTGHQWGTTSLARVGMKPQEVAAQIWGADWQSNPRFSQAGIDAMVNGYEAPNGQIVSGQRGMQAYQMDLQWRAQQAQMDAQQKQFDLQYAFTTGIGLNKYAGITNPVTGQAFGFNTGTFGFDMGALGKFQSQGGGMWGLEDTQRALGYAQQEWQFDFQNRQAEMQNRQWWENTMMSRRQSTAQRGWTMEDWGYQATMRGLQWQWQQEDYQEEARFLTGRERRKAERGMKRATITHNLEEEQIEKQQERQKELWRMEDERFILAKKQHNEQIKMEEESRKVAQQFYEERKKLEEEQVKMQRAMWVENMKIQQEQMQVARQLAMEMQKLSETMMMMSWYTEDWAARLQTLTAQGFADFADASGGGTPGLSPYWENKAKGSGGGDNDYTPAYDGTNFDPSITNPGGINAPKVGETPLGGGTTTTPDAGSLSDPSRSVSNPSSAVAASSDPATIDPWSTPTIRQPSTTNSVSAGTTVIVNIGNDELRRYIANTIDDELKR